MTPRDLRQTDLHLRYAVRTDIGPARERNEDAAYAGGDVLALADGMGGHPGGDVAAALMVAPFANLHRDEGPGRAGDRLARAAVAGNEAIRAYASVHPQFAGMGTTLTAVVLELDELTLVHAGDSRAYMTQGAGVIQLSHDDTLVQSMVDSGALAPDQVRTHPRRNVVTRSMMGAPDDFFMILTMNVVPGDRLLLCSDGVSDTLPDDQLADALLKEDLDDCATHLVEMAIGLGSRDNVTCIVAEVVGDEPRLVPVFAGSAAERTTRR